MGFNIAAVAVAMTSTLHLKDAADNLLYADGPAGDDAKPTKLPVRWTGFGPGSDEYARATTARTNKTVDRMRKKAGKVRLSADESRQEAADFLTAITQNFENLDYPADSPVSTPAQIHAVFSDRSIGFIADQVQEYVGDWENFTKSSATS